MHPEPGMWDGWSKWILGGAVVLLLIGVNWLNTSRRPHESGVVVPEPLRIASATTSTTTIPESTTTIPESAVLPDAATAASSKTEVDDPPLVLSEPRPVDPQPLVADPVVTPSMANTKPLELTPSVAEETDITIIHAPLIKPRRIQPHPRLPKIKPRRIMVEATSPIESSAQSTRFMVSYGCFSSLQEIAQRREQIEQRGWPVVFTQYQIGPTAMTCVHSGPFASAREADQATELFEEKGCMQVPKK
ncbi:MAG: hypothetical protein HQL92_04940 [Magnetococcales bacterium]|nr:hypothetical protein [Magnetococcales bacterium]